MSEMCIVPMCVEDVFEDEGFCTEHQNIIGESNDRT